MKKIISIVTSILIFASAYVTAFADYENTHKNTGDLKQDILAIAGTQIGYTSDDSGSKYDSAVSGTYENWSGAFIGWCANEATAPEAVIPRTADINKLYEFYESDGKIYNPDEHFPGEGDLVFLSKNGKINLCGFVTDSDNEYITVIVGGENNAVYKKMYSVTLSKIYAYATPDYNVDSDHKPGKHMTTASALNFRPEPTTSSSVICTIPLGTIVTITSINGEWGKITYNGTEGWINLQYVVPYDDSHIDTSEYSVLWNVIDISKWQGNINWDKIAETNINGVIIRIGLRGTATKELLTDEKFFEYYKGAINAGLHVGCYFYSAATTNEEAREEANYVVDMIRKHNLKFDMPVYMDMEDEVVRRTGRTQIFNSTKAFLDVMKEENIYTGVYCSTTWAQDYYTPALFSGHSLWIADWHDKCGYEGDYGMWQYTDRGSVSGIDANYTDLNLCYINYPKLIADQGYNKIPDESTKIIPGDINNDGLVTASDARIALRTAAKLHTLTEKETKKADMDSDGKVTASDARKILRISAKLE